ncbi:MAG: RsmB/NOP family class I SAM-dependent RNA methyltransferase [Treponema sp.]|nr:RsmB/NOP family class I SAM-dependent RNA methyltransferase [Treponema sp.]
MAKQKKLIGAEAFEKYYFEQYGERWAALKASFTKESDYAEFHMEGTSESYFLDSASVLAALQLPIENASELLDLCAAPGGKTLVIASRMNQSAVLSSNERSPERKHRLSTVVQNCLPSDISERVKTSCSDGATWCTRQVECFDSILLDAPCSSERHVYNDPKYLNVWTPSRIKTVSNEEWALLSCAFRLLRPEGYLLYSTCALARDENDGMLERLLKKFKGQVQIMECTNFSEENLPAWIKTKLPVPEKTEYGYHVLPDQSDGAGPIYFSLVKKIRTSLHQD